MDSEDDRRVLDPAQDGAALKALTHPLRLTLLGLLRQHGPATASELAVRTGESSASTSYHLRVLAKYAFVAEADHRDSRERRWRSVHDVTSWSNEAMHASPGGSVILSVLHRADRAPPAVPGPPRGGPGQRLLGEEWQEPSGISDLMPRLTPESLAELWEVFRAKTAELTARDAEDPRAEQVVLFTAGLPLAQEDTAAGEDS